MMILRPVEPPSLAALQSLENGAFKRFPLVIGEKRRGNIFTKK
jgi:hypothetical protein